MALRKKQRLFNVASLKAILTVLLAIFCVGTVGVHDAAYGALQIRKALWSVKNQALDVKAVSGTSETLTVTYDGVEYTMDYLGRNGQYALRIGPVCYAETLAVTSSTGSISTMAVTVRRGSAAGFECVERTCPDADSDGYEDAACGGSDCDDGDGGVNPGAAEICGDGIDQDCVGGDEPCQGGPHDALRYEDYPGNCISCHSVEARDMFESTHYTWQGEAPDMVNGAGQPQGKLNNAVNSYCVNILGDWPVCGSCHVGRGAMPDDPDAGLENIDCLACHSEEYAAARTRLADGSMGVKNPTDFMVRNVHLPTRANCLFCHANAGGGDGVKRGDLSRSIIANTDPGLDVHMNRTGSDLNCQSCHVFENHRVIGKGSDLRPTDDLARGSEINCAVCHTGKDGPEGHENSTIGRHVARVACQTCHIPTYAKVPTETHREWLRHHDGSPADESSGPGHPYTLKAADLIPEYLFWNRLSDNYLLYDDASLTYDAAAGTYPTSRPAGGLDDANSKLYPFKYKTAEQPIIVSDNRLIALDTFEYLKVSGDADASVRNGLMNMGYSRDEPYGWIITDTYQMLNHGVEPSSQALQCSECHENRARMDLAGELGYALKAPLSVLCVQCHSYKSPKPFVSMHDKHVKDKRYDCSWCHNFSRPERGLH